MVSQEVHDVERKIAAILRVLSDSPQPLGGRVISRKLKDMGINLSERAVRYHLKLMDERGLTSSTGSREGRLIAREGLEELKNALVGDKIGFVNARINQLSYLTSLDIGSCEGNVPVDITFFPEDKFMQALEIMTPIFRYGLCATDLVAVAHEGRRIGDVVVPAGKIGFATLCSVTVNGLLLKAGIPIDSVFTGLLQMRSHKPLRFVDLVQYEGSTLDPSEMFITSRMTDVTDAVTWGDGKIVASYHEIPLQSQACADDLIGQLRKLGACKLVLGMRSGDIYEMPVRSNKIALVLLSSLNPVAAVAEAGIGVTCKAMSGLIPYNVLGQFASLLKKGRR